MNVITTQLPSRAVVRLFRRSSIHKNYFPASVLRFPKYYPILIQSKRYSSASSPIPNDVWSSLQQQFSRRLNEHGQYQLLTVEQQERIKKYPVANEVSRKAAVLVLLLNVDREPSILFTKRSSHMKQHADEISFPGGHHDEGTDASLRETALRELEEEIQPSPEFMETIRVLGEVTPIPSLNGTPVTPIVAASFSNIQSEDFSRILPGDHNEVESVFYCTIPQLVEAEDYHRLPENRFGVTHAPVFPTQHHGKIWGLTAMILRPLLHSLLVPVFIPQKSKIT